MQSLVSPFLLLLFCSLIHSYKVLLLTPVGTSTQNDVFCGIAKGLVDRGHNVTLLSGYPPNFYRDKFTIVKIAPRFNFLQDISMFSINSSTLNSHVANVIKQTAKDMYELDRVKALLANKHLFDTIVTPAFLNELAYAFLVDFQGAYVTVYSQGAEHYALKTAMFEGDDTGDVNPLLGYPYFGSYSEYDKLQIHANDKTSYEGEMSTIYPNSRTLLKQHRKKLKQFEK